MKKQAIEYHADDVALTIDLTKEYVNEKSPHQHIQIGDSKSYGKLLLLDHLFMCSENDGFIGSEMITHIPMTTGFPKKKVLVIGGGDGRTVGELLKYKTVKTIDVVDIDEKVVKYMKKYFKEVKKNLEHPKVKLHIIDGLEYMRQHKGEYDIIFMTSTDPSSLSSPLFTDEFYKLCNGSLNDKGVFLTDAYMPFYAEYPVNYVSMYYKLQKYFKIVKMYTATIPIFPGGLFAWVVGSKRYDPEKDVISFKVPDCRYYNPDIRKSSFALPQFMIDRIKKEKPTKSKKSVRK